MNFIREVTTPRLQQTPPLRDSVLVKGEISARRTPRILLGLGAVLYASIASVHAQTWENVDALAPASLAEGIASDSVGNIFVWGSYKDATGRNHALIRKSYDGGSAWAPSADYPSANDAGAPNGSLASFTAVAAADVAGEHHLLAAGRIKRVPFGGTFTGQWLVVRSKDAGTNWETVDEYSHPTYNQISGATVPGGVAVDANGTIYVVGSAEEKIVTVKGKSATTTYVNHWLIRKGVASDTGVSWATVGDLAYPASTDAERGNVFPSGVACVGNDVFVVGGGAGTWVVRKSSDGGATWLVVDTFRYSTSDNSHAFGLAVDSQGGIFVVGEAAQTTTSGRGANTTTTTDKLWIVRKSVNGGSSWTQESQYQYPTTSGRAGAYAVAVSSNDDLYVAGYGSSGTNPTRWITRKRAANTGLWTTTDDFISATGAWSQGQAVAVNPFGTVFSAGISTYPPDNTWGWLVRRLIP